VDGISSGMTYFRHTVDCASNHIEESAFDLLAHRHGNANACSNHFLTALKTFGGIHRNGAHGVFTDVLLTLHDQVATRALHHESVEDIWEFMTCRETDIDNRADDLGNFSYVLRHCEGLNFGRESMHRIGLEKTFLGKAIKEVTCSADYS
jgi:hypothetical protein